MICAVIAFAAVVVAYPSGGVATAIGGALAAVVAYLLESRIWPWRKCRRCSGNPRRHNPDGHAWRHCRRCDGSGRERRLLAGADS